MFIISASTVNLFMQSKSLFYSIQFNIRLIQLRQVVTDNLITHIEFVILPKLPLAPTVEYVNVIHFFMWLRQAKSMRFGG